MLWPLKRLCKPSHVGRICGSVAMSWPLKRYKNSSHVVQVHFQVYYIQFKVRTEQNFV